MSCSQSPSMRPGDNPVEALLTHPAVAGASIVLDEAPDGRRYPVAYVVAHADPAHRASADVCAAERERKLSQWKRAFDQAYRPRVDDPAPSFIGWTSCYTNRPLPDAEMREWLSCTVDRILALGPERVLEIGCGVSLLVEQVAPRCAACLGTDLSSVAVASLRDFASLKPDLAHVELIEREAADLVDRPARSSDTVIINLVVQYFPDIDYLRGVIG